jgi:hypothetical protein
MENSIFIKNFALTKYNQTMRAQTKLLQLRPKYSSARKARIYIKAIAFVLDFIYSIT